MPSYNWIFYLMVTSIKSSVRASSGINTLVITLPVSSYEIHIENSTGNSSLLSLHKNNNDSTNTVQHELILYENCSKANTLRRLCDLRTDYCDVNIRRCLSCQSLCSNKGMEEEKVQMNCKRICPVYMYYQMLKSAQAEKKATLGITRPNGEQCGEDCNIKEKGTSSPDHFIIGLIIQAITLFVTICMGVILNNKIKSVIHTKNRRLPWKFKKETEEEAALLKNDYNRNNSDSEDDQQEANPSQHIGTVLVSADVDNTKVDVLLEQSLPKHTNDGIELDISYPLDTATKVSADVDNTKVDVLLEQSLPKHKNDGIELDMSYPLDTATKDLDKPRGLNSIDIEQEYKRFKIATRQHRLPHYFQSCSCDTDTKKIYIDIEEGNSSEANDFFTTHFNDLMNKGIIQMVEQGPQVFAAKGANGEPALNQENQTLNNPQVYLAKSKIQEGVRLFSLPNKFSHSDVHKLCSKYKTIEELEDFCKAMDKDSEIHKATGSGFVSDQNKDIYMLTVCHFIKEPVHGMIENERIPIITEITKPNGEGKLIYLGNEVWGGFDSIPDENEVDRNGVDMALIKVFPDVLHGKDIDLQFKDNDGNPIQIIEYDQVLHAGTKVVKTGQVTGKPIVGEIIEVKKSLNVDNELWDGCIPVHSFISESLKVSTFSQSGDSGSLVKQMLYSKEGKILAAFAAGMVFKFGEKYTNLKTGKVYNDIVWCVRINHCFKYAKLKFNLDLEFCKPGATYVKSSCAAECSLHENEISSHSEATSVCYVRDESVQSSHGLVIPSGSSFIPSKSVQGGNPDVSSIGACNMPVVELDPCSDSLFEEPKSISENRSTDTPIEYYKKPKQSYNLNPRCSDSSSASTSQIESSSLFDDSTEDHPGIMTMSQENNTKMKPQSNPRIADTSVCGINSTSMK